MSKISVLIDRAEQMRAVRHFFFERNVLEVDTPLLGKSAPVDLHIDVMTVPGMNGYLHTSPEYAMKRLLSSAIGDIYQFSHVFREGEIGPLHNPEFTMLEWYRIGFTYSQMIEETENLVRLILGNLPVQRLTYGQALLHYANLDYKTASCSDLLDCASIHGLSLSSAASASDKDTLLQALMGFVVEPKLQELTTLTHFPATQAALAKTALIDGEPIAYRFEIYYKGIELANGYWELTDAEEQRRRFEKSNIQRMQMGKEALKIDEKFLEALQKGLPDCCGVAVGFDRLMLLRHHKKSLSEVLPFAWDDI